MRWGRTRQAEPIDLADTTIDRSSLEVIELEQDAPRTRAHHPLSGLTAPREVAYARPTNDPGSLRGLWEAVNRLES